MVKYSFIVSNYPVFSGVYNSTKHDEYRNRFDNDLKLKKELSLS